MTTLELVGGIFLIVISLMVIFIVVSQESKKTGANSVMGGQSESYLSKNRSKTLDSKLVNVTKVLVLIFFIATIGMKIISSNT